MSDKKQHQHAGIVVGATEVALQLAAGQPIEAAVASVAAARFAAWFGAAMNARAAQRVSEFRDTLLDALDVNDDEGVEALRNNPDFEEAIFQNYRRAMDAIDPAVVKPLGRLAASYRYKKPDHFMRAAGRLLQDLDAGELLALRGMMEAGAQVIEPLVAIRSFVGTNVRLQIEPFEGNTPTPPAKVHFVPQTQEAMSVLRLLARGGLTSDGPGGAMIIQSGLTLLTRDNVVALLKLVRA